MITVPRLLVLLATACFLGTLCIAADSKGTARNVSVDEADQLLKGDKSIIVLDVRTADEFKAGHIPGARNMDFLEDDFKAQAARLDRSKTYLLHCQAGGRSARAQKVLQEMNFKSILHLNAGFGGWEAAGKPVQK